MQFRGYSNSRDTCNTASGFTFKQHVSNGFPQEYCNTCYPTEPAIVIYRRTDASPCHAILAQHPTKTEGKSERTKEKHSACWKVSNCLLILHCVFGKETQTLMSRAQILIYQVNALTKPSFRYWQIVLRCTFQLRPKYSSKSLWPKSDIDTDYDLNQKMHLFTRQILRKKQTNQPENRPETREPIEWWRMSLHAPLLAPAKPDTVIRPTAYCFQGKLQLSKISTNNI